MITLDSVPFVKYKSIEDFLVHHTRTHMLLIGPMNGEIKLDNLVNVIVSMFLHKKSLSFLRYIQAIPVSC